MIWMTFSGLKASRRCSEIGLGNLQEPTLGLSFKTQEGLLRTQLQPYRMRLMPFFSNLLPEGHLRQYLAERGEVFVGDRRGSDHASRALGAEAWVICRDFSRTSCIGADDGILTRSKASRHHSPGDFGVPRVV